MKIEKKASMSHSQKVSEYEHELATLRQRVLSAKDLLHKHEEAIADYEMRMMTHEREIQGLVEDRQQAEDNKKALEDSILDLT